MLFVRDDAFVGADADSRSLPARVAVSDVTDGFLGFDLAGHGAADLIRLATTYDFTDPTLRPAESALMEFAGFKVAIVRRERGWRVYVERPVAAALWHWFEKVS
jgi:sarcosine oxidase gamma subunit